MNLTPEEKEKIKTYCLIKEGVEITEVTEFYDYLLLKPYRAIDFKDKIYTNKQILQELYLDNNNISDLSPLSSLSNLKELYLYENNISDIYPLSNLTNLETLFLGSNKIIDISPLSNLSNLKILDLDDTNISDISPLSKLTNLEHLYLQYNNLSKVQIKELKLKLPNCMVYF